MTPKSSWVGGRVDTLLAALGELGMSASRAAARELIQERVQWASAQMGISPTAARRYLTDDALADLARTMVVSVADENTWRRRHRIGPHRRGAATDGRSLHRRSR